MRNLGRFARRFTRRFTRKLKKTNQELKLVLELETENYIFFKDEQHRKLF